MSEPSGNELGLIALSAGDVRGLRALLQIANDRSCATATRELARLGLAGYLSTILGEPAVIEDGGACEQPDSGGKGGVPTDTPAAGAVASEANTFA